jgi:predicted dehydrogenase
MVENKKIVNLGIVGCGDISIFHGNALQNIPNARFSACADLDERRAKGWAEKYGCHHSYTDYLKMIREEQLDGVLLATWPNQHPEQISQCAGAGVKNILCEKSLALTGSEAVGINRIVQKNGMFLMEGFMYRHHPAIKQLEKIIAQGEIGRVDNVRAVFSDFDPEQESAQDMERNWRQRKDRGGGIPYDFACYAVNACGYFSGGLPVRAYATGGISEKYDVINRLYGMIEYDNGCVGIIESSKKSSFSEELQISCANGILNLPLSWTIYDEVRIRQTYRSEWAHVHENTYGIQKTDSYQKELENFVGVITGTQKPGMPLNETLVNIFVIEALVNSLLTRQIVEIKLPAEIMAQPI